MMNPFELTIDEVVDNHRQTLRRSFYLLLPVVGAVLLSVYTSVPPYLVLIGFGITALALLPTYLWISGRAHGLPIVPALCLNEIIWFAVPILSRADSIQGYLDGEIFGAGLMEIVFLAVLILVWYRHTRTRPVLVDRALMLPMELLASGRLVIIFLVLFGLSALFHVCNNAGWTWILFQYLPAGSISIARTLAISLGILAVFFLSFALGSRLMSVPVRLLYISLFVLYFTAATANLLLVTVVPVVMAAAAGYVLGSGRFPWRFLLAIALALNLMNLGKYEMRKKYWEMFEGTPVALRPWEYHHFFAEWAGEGMKNLRPQDHGRTESNADTLLERTSMIQMVLFAQREAPEKVDFLYGDTIAVIPKLLVPRILWPDKPRTHQGQVILNIHFGRQTEEGAEKTYIAWGLLAESYANFGYFGPVLLGLFLGTVLGRVSTWSASAPLASYRSAVGVVVLIASISATQISLAVWVTMLFQALVILTAVAVIVMKVQPLVDSDAEAGPYDPDREVALT